MIKCKCIVPEKYDPENFPKLLICRPEPGDYVLSNDGNRRLVVGSVTHGMSNKEPILFLSLVKE
jgi:hypothetical protein